MSSDLAYQLTTSLPEWNGRIASGAPARDLVDYVEPLVAKITSELEGVESATIHSARELLKLAGFIASTVEKHYQESGAAPGAGITEVNRLEQALATLGDLALHPPRDSIYTYCIWNREPTISFTGSRQELSFIAAVRNVDGLLTAAGECLRPISTGEIEVVSIDGERHMNSAADILGDAAEELAVLASHKPSALERRVEPDFFARTLRTYWPTFPVSGQTWPGPSAAALGSQIALDFLIGTVDRAYKDHVSDRAGLLPQEIWPGLIADMNRPSIAHRLSKILRLSESEATSQFKRFKPHFEPHQATALQAYARLVRAAARITTIHWALVRKYVIEPGSRMQPRQSKRLAVPPESGSSGLSMQQVRGLSLMRRKHPLASALVRLAEDVRS